jgi:hypothetical protein
VFGLSFGKILLLALVVFAVWRLFRWFEQRPSGPPAEHRRRPPAADEKPGEVELEQDPETGVWRPKKRD